MVVKKKNIKKNKTKRDESLDIDDNQKKVNITKKLNNLVKYRKTHKVIYEKGSVKYVSKGSGDGGLASEGYAENYSD